MRLDPVELEYERAIRQATQQGDNDRAHELSIWLRQYQDAYKVPR